MSAQASHVSSDIEVIFVFTLLPPVFMIRLVSPLPYIVDSPYDPHIDDGKCPHVTLTYFQCQGT